VLDPQRILWAPNDSISQTSILFHLFIDTLDYLPVPAARIFINRLEVDITLILINFLAEQVFSNDNIVFFS